MATNRHVIPANNKMLAPSSTTTVAGLLLAVVAATLLVLLYHFQSNMQFAAVLALLLGFTAVSAVRLIQPRPSTTIEPRVTFNENDLLAQLSVVINNVMPAPQREPRQTPWDVQARELVGTNDALALAKVRLDLERELRRLLNENGIAQPRSHSVRHYAEILMDRRIIPPEMLPPLLEVSRVANAAVHGADVTTDVAAGAVRVGEELVEILRALPKDAA